MDDETSYRNDVTEATEKRSANTTNASKKTIRKAGKKAAKTAAKAKTRSAALKRQTAVGARGAESKTPVTEIPVPLPPPPKTSQYLVTVDNSSRVITRIEKVNRETGEKKQLSESESIAFASELTKPLAAPAFANPVAATPAFTSPLATTNVTGLNSLFQGAPSEDPALTDAYYRGVADYLHAMGLA